MDISEVRLGPLAVELAEGIDPFVIVFSEKESLDAFMASPQFDIPAVVSEIPPSNLIELLEVCLRHDFAENVLLDPPPWDDLQDDPSELMMFTAGEFIEATKEAYRRHG